MNAPFPHLRESAFTTHAFARITRFVPTLPGAFLCRLDRVRNINLVSKERYDELDRDTQRLVYRAEGDIVVG